MHSAFSICRENVQSIGKRLVIGFCHYFITTLVSHRVWIMLLLYGVNIHFSPSSFSSQSLDSFLRSFFLNKHINFVVKLTLEIYLIRLLNGFTHNFIWAVWFQKMHRRMSLPFFYIHILVPRRKFTAHELNPNSNAIESAQYTHMDMHTELFFLSFLHILRECPYCM